VAAHDGSVSLSATPGGGTTATVSLPGTAEVAQPSALAASRTTVALAQPPPNSPTSDDAPATSARTSWAAPLHKEK
jgi:hypothetical protein